MSLELRPLTLGELLDRSFSLYRQHFWLFVGIMALPSLLALAFGVMIALFNPQPVNPASITPQTRPAEVIGAMVWMVAAMGVMTVVYFVTYAVALGATTVAVSQLYMNQPVTIRGAYAPMQGRVARLALLLMQIFVRLGATFFLGIVALAIAAAAGAVLSPILSVLSIVVGFGAVFVLCAWIALRYAVAVPAAVLEGASSADAIRRSVHLTRGNLWRVFALMAFTMIITYAVLAVFQGPFIAAGALAGPEAPIFFWTNLLGTVSGAVGGAFTAPLMIVAFAVLYYDLRIRKEGLDLQLMLANLDRAQGASPAAASSAVLPG